MTVAHFGAVEPVRSLGWRVSVVAAAISRVEAVGDWHAFVRNAHHVLSLAVVVLGATAWLRDYRL